MIFDLIFLNPKAKRRLDPFMIWIRSPPVRKKKGGGEVTHAVRAGAPPSIVQKCMRVKSEAMVGYYATLRGEDLEKLTKLAF